MNWAKELEPKNTEEVKPGLFIQKRYGKKGKVKYRRVYPAAWKGEINWKNLIMGGTTDFWKNTILFLIIIFLVFSYWHDTNELREFHDKVNQNKLQWCAGVPYEELGGPTETHGGENDEGILTIQDYPKEDT